MTSDDVILVKEEIDLTDETRKPGQNWTAGYIMVMMFQKLVIQSPILKAVHLNKEGKPISVKESLKSEQQYVAASR